MAGKVVSHSKVGVVLFALGAGTSERDRAKEQA